MDRMEDAEFTRWFGAELAGLPGVLAVTLGGSRASGTSRPGSDRDFAIYYRRDFDPSFLRNKGWPGAVSEIGGWDGGVMNGGAWLTVGERRVDVHYRAGPGAHAERLLAACDAASLAAAVESVRAEVGEFDPR